jgi:predicted transcriptional regulator
VKSIKQIADEFGIPKHKVKYQVEKLPKNCVEKIGEILHVTDEGMAILKDLHVEKKISKVENFSEELSSQLIEVLKSELETKNKLLEAQSRQITELTNALTVAQQTAAAAQALHAGTMKHISDSENTEESKRGFFSRIFKRQ